VSLTSTGIQAALAQSTGEVFIELLTISLDDATETFRIARNTENVTSNGNTFTGCAFEMDLPNDDGESISSIRLRVDNVDRFLTEAVRTYSEGTVLFEVVLASDPDNLQAGPFNFVIDEAVIDSETVEFRLTIESLLSAPAARHKFTPGKFPALFK